MGISYDDANRRPPSKNDRPFIAITPICPWLFLAYRYRAKDSSFCNNPSAPNMHLAINIKLLADERQDVAEPPTEPGALLDLARRRWAFNPTKTKVYPKES